MTKRDTPLKGDAIASPCGLIAKSFFNDTFSMMRPNGTPVIINETGISWPNDKGKKFKVLKINLSSRRWRIPRQRNGSIRRMSISLCGWERLVYRTFVSCGVISIHHYLMGPTCSRLITSTTPKPLLDIRTSCCQQAVSYIRTSLGPFGGKNYFLSIAFIVVGVICILIAVAFFIKKKLAGDAFGEKKDNW